MLKKRLIRFAAGLLAALLLLTAGVFADDTSEGEQPPEGPSPDEQRQLIEELLSQQTVPAIGGTRLPEVEVAPPEVEVAPPVVEVAPPVAPPAPTIKAELVVEELQPPVEELPEQPDPIEKTPDVTTTTEKTPDVTTTTEKTPTVPTTGEQPETELGKTTGLTPEQIAMINRIIAMNGGQGQTKQPQNQQSSQPNRPVVDVSDKNTGTEEQETLLQGFLEEHPHDSVWNNDNIYKNYAACAAFAMQAQQTIFGEDAHYVSSSDINDIRQYSAVKLILTSGTHWVFITRVNEDGTYQVAEGNANGRVRIGCNYAITQNSVMAVWNPA